tara:strand:- start:252393 stop:253868 length:1476 start_codon:yes stop_codon:yes gene_type:complete
MESDVSLQPPEIGEHVPPEMAFEWARESVREKDWSMAARRWAMLRKVYPDEPTTWFQAVHAHLEAGQLDAAESLLAIARERFPNQPYAKIQPAHVAMKREQWDLAKSILEQLRVDCPLNPHTWTSLALLANHDGDFEAESGYLWKAAECTPNQPGFYIQFAESAMNAERYKEAGTRWAILRERFPELPIGYRRGAAAARAMGDHEAARDLLLAHQYGDEFVESLSDDAEPDHPSTLSPLNQLLGLVWIKALYNLRSEVRRNYLSFGWWIIEPLMYMGIYMLVFDVLLTRGGDNYSLLLMTGLIPWMWTMKSISTSSVSILQGQQLMLQTGVQPIFFPLVMLVQAALKQIPVYILLIGFVWMNGNPPGLHWFALLPIIVVQALFTAAASLAISAAIPFFRDLTNLVPTGLTLLMFMSGIFYDYSVIDQKWHGLFLLNPAAFLIKCYREVFIDHSVPDLLALSWRGALSAIVCGVLLIAYRKLRYVYPRVVME